MDSIHSEVSCFHVGAGIFACWVAGNCVIFYLFNLLIIKKAATVMIQTFAPVSALLALDGGHYGVLCLFQAVCLQ